MGLIDDNRERQPDSNVLREPLAGINNTTGQPPQANGQRPQERVPRSGPQSQAQRRSLSDVQGTGDKPHASDRRPRMTRSASPRIEIPDVESNGALIDLNAPPDEPEQPVRLRRPRSMTKEPVPKEPKPPTSRPRQTADEQVVEEQASRPRLGQPRSAIQEPVAEEQEHPPQPSQPRPVNEAPVAEEQEYQPRPSRPRLAVSAPGDETEVTGNGRPRLAHAQPEAEEREVRPTPGQPQAVSPQPPADIPEAPAKAHRPRLGQDGRISAGSNGSTQPRSSTDQARLEQLLGQLRRRQSLTLAMVTILTMAAIGAVAWIVYTTLMGRPII